MRGTKKAKVFKTLIVPLVMVWLLFFAFPRGVLATRSYAGGGELAKFSFSDFALTVGISLASYGIGSTLSSALSGSSLASSFNSAIELSNVIQGYNTYMATSQVSRAVGMAGSYHEWDPRWTFAASTMATGATAGYLNPELALGKEVGKGIDQVNPISPSSMWKGASVGALGGAAQGATIALIDGERIDDYKSPGVVAQIVGQAAGIYATSVGRAICDPATYHYQTEGYYERNPGGNFQEIGYKNGKIVPKGEAIPKGTFEEKYGDPFATGEAVVDPYKSEVYPRRLVKVTHTKAELSSSQIRSNKFIQPLKYTINQWPELATSALTIGAVDYLLKVDGKIPEDKEYLEPLVSAVVSSVASPILHSVSSTYGLSFMDEGDKMVQVARMRQIGFEYDMKEYLKGPELEKLPPEAREQKISEFRKDLKIEYKKGFGNLTPEAQQEINDFRKRVRFEHEMKRYIKRLDLEKLSPQVRKQKISEFRKDLKIEYKGNENNKLGKGIDEVLKDADLVRPEIVLSQSWDSARFGLLHGLVSGGLQSYIAKNWDLEDSPVNYMLASSVANLGSALVRGAVWYAGWENSLGGRENLEIDLASLTSNELKKYEDQIRWAPFTRITEDEPGYEKLGKETGLEPETKYKPMKEPSPGGGKELIEIEVKKPVTYREIRFPDQRPQFGKPIGDSFRLATIDYGRNALSFGRPYLYKPEDVKNITPLAWVNYVGRLRYLSNLGITSALAYTAGGAHIGAAATNIKTSVSHIPVLRGIFSVQPQRYVATNSDKMPFTLQTFGYESSLTNVKTTSFVPFDRVYIKISTDTGEIIRNVMSGQPRVEEER